MKIDITPTKKLATNININVALDVYQKPLYCVEDEAGKQVCATFDPEQLAMFQPNRAVSEMMEAWTNDNTGTLTFCALKATDNYGRPANYEGQYKLHGA